MLVHSQLTDRERGQRSAAERKTKVVSYSLSLSVSRFSVFMFDTMYASRTYMHGTKHTTCIRRVGQNCIDTLYMTV